MADFLTGLTFWKVADQIVAYLYIILFIWGGSNKFGKKLEFNDDFTSLDVMKSLRGFAAIGVMLHHISQEYFLQEEGVLSAFVNAGAYFVAIFFFCSGYGLIKSLDTKKDYLKGFISKRIVKSIVVPFYVNAIIYGLFFFIVKIPLDKTQWVTNLLGITMMNEYAWFPIVLAILYLLFYLCFRFIKNRPVCFAIIFVFIIAMGIGTCINGHFAWWAGEDNWWMTEEGYMSAKWWMYEKVFWFNGEWWVNSAPAFLTGLIFASYEKQIVSFFKKSYALKFHVLLIITMIFYQLSSFGQSKFGYWTEYNMNGPEIGNKIVTFFCQVPLFLVLTLTIFVFLMKYHVKNPVLAFFGKYSLHTYLMNLAAIMLMRFTEFGVLFDYGKGNFLIFGLSVLILSTLFGVGEQKITEKVQNFLFKDRKKQLAFTAPVIEPAPEEKDSSDGNTESTSADDSKTEPGETSESEAADTSKTESTETSKSETAKASGSKSAEASKPDQDKTSDKKSDKASESKSDNVPESKPDKTPDSKAAKKTDNAPAKKSGKGKGKK